MSFTTTDLGDSAKLAPTRTSVVGNIQNFFAQKGVELSEDQAINVLAFHNEIRAKNNKMFAAANVDEEFATRKKGASKFASGANEAADAIPFGLGTFVKPVTLAAKLLSGHLEEAERERGFAAYRILNPGGDPATAAAMSRAAADRITEADIAKIADCKNEEEARNLAEKRHEKMVELMADRQEEMKATYKTNQSYIL
jgi:hypothetical protein